MESIVVSQLVSLLAKSEIKRANLLAVYQYINYIHRQLQLPERGRTFSETNAIRGMCNQKKKKETIMTTVKDWKLWATLSCYFTLKSNSLKSNKRTVKELWKELVKFRLKCLPHVTVLAHVWHHVQRRHATQPTLSLPLRKNFEQPNKYILTVSRRGAVL